MSETFFSTLVAISVNVDATFIYSSRDIFHVVFRSYLYPWLAARTLINDGIVNIKRSPGNEENARIVGTRWTRYYGIQVVQDER